MWTLKSRAITAFANRVTSKIEQNNLAISNSTSVLRTIMSTFFQILWVPGGVGLLGIMLACEKTEPWSLRLLGGVVAVVMIPFMLLTVVGLLVSEGIDKIKELRAK